MSFEDLNSYRIINDLLLSGRRYDRDIYGSHYAGKVEFPVSNQASLIKAVNLLIDRSKEILEKTPGQSPQFKYATEVSPIAILSWEHSTFEINVQPMGINFKAYGFNPEILHQQVLMAIKDQRSSKGPNDLDLVIKKLRLANATSALSTTSFGEIGANSNTPRITNHSQGLASNFEKRILESQRTKTKGRVLGG